MCGVGRWTVVTVVTVVTQHIGIISCQSDMVRVLPVVGRCCAMLRQTSPRTAARDTQTVHRDTRLMSPLYWEEILRQKYENYNESNIFLKNFYLHFLKFPTLISSHIRKQVNNLTILLFYFLSPYTVTL